MTQTIKKPWLLKADYTYEHSVKNNLLLNKAKFATLCLLQ